MLKIAFGMAGFFDTRNIVPPCLVHVAELVGGIASHIPFTGKGMRLSSKWNRYLQAGSKNRSMRRGRRVHRLVNREYPISFGKPYDIWRDDAYKCMVNAKMDAACMHGCSL